MIRRLLLGAGLSLLSLLLIIALLLVPPRTIRPFIEPLRGLLLDTVMVQVSKALKGSIEIGKMRGSLLGKPSLHDIVVRDSDGSVVAQIYRLKVQFALVELLNGQLGVPKVEIIKPSLVIVEDETGELGLIRALSPRRVSASKPTSDEFGLALSSSIDRLEIREGQIDLRLSSLQGVETIKDISLHLQGSLNQQGLQVELQQFSAHAEPADVSIETLQGKLSMHAGDVQLRDMVFKTRGTHITLDGGWPGDAPSVDGALNLHSLDMAEIGRLLNDDTLHGLLQAHLIASGPRDALELSGQIDVADSRIALSAWADTLSAPQRYRAELDISDLDLAAVVERLALRSDLNMSLRLEGEGFSLPDLKGEMQLDIQPSHLGEITIHPSRAHLQVRSERLQVRSFDLKTSVLEIGIAGDVGRTGQSDLRYQLHTELKGLRSLLEVKQLTGSIQSQGQLSGSWPDIQARGSLKAKGLSYEEHFLKSLTLDYEAQRLGDQPLFEGRLRVHESGSGEFVVEDITLQASYAADRQLHFETQVKQSSRIGAKTQGNLSFKDSGQQLVLDVLELQLDDHLWQAKQPLQLDLSPEGFSLRPFRFGHANESIEISGSLHDRQIQDLTLQAQRIDMDFIQRTLSLPDVVRGRADLEARLQGTLDDPSFLGELSIRALPKRPDLPVGLVRLNLSYDQRQLLGRLRAHHDIREVVAMDLQLPADFSLVDKPVEQRLLDGPLNVHLEVKSPNLSILQRDLPDLPEVLSHVDELVEEWLVFKRPEFLRQKVVSASPPPGPPGTPLGTLEGKLDLKGPYTSLELETDLEFYNLGVKGVFEQLEGPVSLRGEIQLASSMASLRQDIANHRVAPIIPRLEIDTPLLKAQLPGKASPQDIEIRQLLLQANAALKAEGLWAKLQNFKAQARFSDLPLTDLALVAELTPKKLTLSRLSMKTPRSKLYGKGYMLLPGQKMRFQLDIPRLHLREFVPALSDDLPAMVEGRIDMTGLAQAPKLNAQLMYAGAKINTDLELQLDQPAPSYTGKILVNALDVSAFLPDLQGMFNASMSLQGKGIDEQDREAQFALDIDSEGFNLAPGLMLNLGGKVSGLTMELDECKLQSAPVELIAQGILSAQQETALVYNMNLGDLSALQQHLGVALNAKGSISGEISGPLDSLSMQGTTYLNELRYADLNAEGLLGNYTAQDIVTAPQATLNARLVGLQAPALPRSSAQLEVNYQEPRGEISFAVTEGPFEQSQLAGNLIYQAGFRGSIDRMHLRSGDWVWKNPQPIEWAYDPQGAAQLEELLLENGNQRITARASLSQQGSISAEARISQLQIQPAILAFAPDADVPEGQLSLDLQVGGLLDQPQLNGSLSIDSLYKQGRSLGEIHGQLNSEEVILNSELRWTEGGATLLHMQGTVDTSRSGALAMHIQSPEFDLARLTPLSKTVLKSAGRLDIDLRLDGTVRQPLAHGSLDIHDGQLRLAEIGETYSDIESKIQFSGHRIEIEELHIGSRTGSAQLSGWLETSGVSLRELDLSLKAKDFSAMNTSAIALRASSDLTLRGSMQDMTASGDIDIPQARIRIDDLPTNEAVEVQPWELTVEGVFGPGPEALAEANAAIPLPIEKDPLPFLRTNIEVEIPRNAWVQSEGTAVEVSGKLQINKEREGPFVLGGYVETLRGFFSLFGKRFELETGRVTFTGSKKINPRLDITATQKVSDYSVYVDVTDTLDEPKITLRSDPELDEADIMSLLLFGRTTERLSSSEQRSSLSSQAGQLAGSVAGGFAAGMLERTLGESLGLDSIAIDEGGGGVGRYITQDLFLSYDRIFNDPRRQNRSGNAINIEYNINRNLNIKATSSDIGETALDFSWSADY